MVLTSVCGSVPTNVPGFSDFRLDTASRPWFSVGTELWVPTVGTEDQVLREAVEGTNPMPEKAPATPDEWVGTTYAAKRLGVSGVTILASEPRMAFSSDGGTLQGRPQMKVIRPSALRWLALGVRGFSACSLRLVLDR